MAPSGPPWDRFFDFPFQSYSSKILLTRQKVFPLPTVGAPLPVTALVLSARGLDGDNFVLKIYTLDTTSCPRKCKTKKTPCCCPNFNIMFHRIVNHLGDYLNLETLQAIQGHERFLKDSNLRRGITPFRSFKVKYK